MTSKKSVEIFFGFNCKAKFFFAKCHLISELDEMLRNGELAEKHSTAALPFNCTFQMNVSFMMSNWCIEFLQMDRMHYASMRYFPLRTRALMKSVKVIQRNSSLNVSSCRFGIIWDVGQKHRCHYRKFINLCTLKLLQNPEEKRQQSTGSGLKTKL